MFPRIQLENIWGHILVLHNGSQKTSFKIYWIMVVLQDYTPPILCSNTEVATPELAIYECVCVCEDTVH